MLTTCVAHGGCKLSITSQQLLRSSLDTGRLLNKRQQFCNIRVRYGSLGHEVVELDQSIVCSPEVGANSMAKRSLLNGVL